MSLSSHSRCLSRSKAERGLGHGEAGLVKTEADSGGVQPHAREPLLGKSDLDDLFRLPASKTAGE